jgi:hypothetical protein
MSTKNDQIPEHTWLIVEAIANLQQRIKTIEYSTALRIPAQMRTVSAYFDLVVGDKESFVKAVERRAKAKHEVEPVTNDADIMLTLKQAAEQTDRSVSTIRRWVRRGLLEGQRGPTPSHGGTPPIIVSQADLTKVAKAMNACLEVMPYDRRKSKHYRKRSRAIYEPMVRRVP